MYVYNYLFFFLLILQYVLYTFLVRVRFTRNNNNNKFLKKNWTLSLYHARPVIFVLILSSLDIRCDFSIYNIVFSVFFFSFLQNLFDDETNSNLPNKHTSRINALNSLSGYNLAHIRESENNMYENK